jgi:hypothetical protein
VLSPPGASGPLSIAQGGTTVPTPTGFSFVGQQINITAPSSTFDRPLELIFKIDASAASGLTSGTVALFRTEGAGSPVAVADCAAGAEAETAVPDPCIKRRGTAGDGDIELHVLTSAASAWNFAKATPSGVPFWGFFWPVSNPPKLNTWKAGFTVPLTFSLGGNRGAGILAAGQPVSRPVSCTAPFRPTGSAVRTSGSLSYSKRSKTYTYAWRTPKSFAKSCRLFSMKLKSGSTHTALFKFVK